MSLDVSTSELGRERGGARPLRAPNPSQTDTRSGTSGDAMVHWLPTSAVIAAMAAAFDAADQEAHAAVETAPEEMGTGEIPVTRETLPTGEADGEAGNATGEAGTVLSAPNPHDQTQAINPTDADVNGPLFTDVGPTSLGSLAVLIAGGGAIGEGLAATPSVGSVIRGTSGDDVLFGDAGDVLLGGSGDDTLIAVSELIGGVSGGSGFDQLIFDTTTGVTGNFASSELERIVGSEQDDAISAEGSSTAIELSGRAGDDLLTGGDGDDTLTGGEGGDILLGLGGDDTFFFDTSDISLDGGTGIDTAIFMDDTGVTFDLAASNIEIAFGGAGDDVFTATGLDALSTIFGGGGNDVVTGGLGVDTAVYVGARDRYEITTQDDGLVLVADTLGFEGVDTLSSIEQLRFEDQDLIL